MIPQADSEARLRPVAPADERSSSAAIEVRIPSPADIRRTPCVEPSHDRIDKAMRAIVLSHLARDERGARDHGCDGAIVPPRRRTRVEIVDVSGRGEITRRVRRLVREPLREIVRIRDAAGEHDVARARSANRPNKRIRSGDIEWLAAHRRRAIVASKRPTGADDQAARDVRSEATRNASAVRAMPSAYDVLRIEPISR